MIAARALVVRFSTGFCVGPVDLALGPGLWHLKGENGAGKTTLLRALCGELRPTSGRVEVDGVDVATVDGRRRIAYVPSRPDLPAFLRVDEAWQTFAALRGTPDWDGRPLRERLGLDGDLLLSHASEGQRRRAELVAGLAGDPTALLLDEPFANLDPLGVDRLATLLADWRSTRAIVVTGHAGLPVPVDGAFALARGEPLRWP